MVSEKFSGDACVLRHPTAGRVFGRRAARPRREAALDRFGGTGVAPWDTQAPKELWTEAERRGAMGLRAVRAVLALTVAGAAMALAVLLWRVFLPG